MNILMPMAGAGSRFVEAGYTIPKPLIPTTQRRTGKKLPMVVAALQDLPVGEQVIVIQRGDFSQQIRAFYPSARFIQVEAVTDGQARTCLLAKDFINTQTPLLIGACDNGMDIPAGAFERLTGESDALIFTFRGNEAVQEKPQAYGWVKVDGEKVLNVSVKLPISQTPLNDHAIVGAFWFRRGSDFVAAAEKMIAADDKVNGEFYVDQAMRYTVRMGSRVKVLELSRYIGWGTPKDYENYERTLEYWCKFKRLPCSHS